MFDELIKDINNVDIFTESFKTFVSEFSFSTFIMLVMTIFTVIAAVDKILGNKRGYGDKFDEGFHTMGPLAIAMVGATTLVPVIQLVIQPIISPIYKFFGASPAMFAGTVLPNDGGAYPLAVILAEGDTAIANFSGLILGCMMGGLITALIPLALTLVEKKDRSYFSAGVLIGLVTIPLGCFFGGLAMNFTPYKMSVIKIILNLIPVIIVAVVISLLLWFKPEKAMKGFDAFGKGVSILITASTAIAIFQHTTGIRFPVFYRMVEPAAPGGLSPLMESLLVVGTIGLALTGAFPFVHWITKVLKKPLYLLSQKLGLNEVASAGMVATLASSIPTLSLLKDMNNKGKIINIAFAISAAFIFGDHLGFTAGVDKNMILPVIIAKSVAGLSALWLALRISGTLLSKIENTSQDNKI